MSELAARQAELVAALVGGAGPPPGFDAARIAATRHALLRKRAGEVARAWPELAFALADGWHAAFADWAAGRAPQGSLRDGWDFARHLATDRRLPPEAAAELAAREVLWHYNGHAAPRRRRLPAVRRIPAGFVVQVAGHVRPVRLPREAEPRIG